MFAFLSLLIIALISVSLGGMFQIWIGGLVGGLLLLATYPLERWLDLPQRIAGWPLALLAPLAWGLTGGFVAMQMWRVQAPRTVTAQLQPLQRDLEAIASLRSTQGKEVFHLKVEKDKVLYTLEVRYRKGLKPTIPAIAAHPTFHGPFIMPKPPKVRFFPAKKGIVIKRWELTLVPVLTGPLDTPRFVIKYRKKGKTKQVIVEPIAIEVSELGKPTQLLASLKAGKPPTLMERPTNPRQMLWWIGLGLGTLLFFLVLAWLQRSKQHVEEQLTAHEWVERELASLDAKGLLTKQEYKSHYFALSEIFRGYLERRFDFPALESTTEEIARWTKQTNEGRALEKDVTRDIRQLLQWLDGVKFAGHTPEQDEQDDAQRRLQSVLRRTIPAPDSTASNADSSADNASHAS